MLFRSEGFEVVVEVVVVEPAGDPGAVAAGGEGEAESGGSDGVEDVADAGAWTVTDIASIIGRAVERTRQIDMRARAKVTAELEARGVKAADVVVMQYPDFGVKLYGNVIIATPKLIKENPAAVKAFLSAFTKGAKEVIANPAKAIESVKARDGIINVELETRRLKLAIDTVINSPDARAEGFGQINAPRLALMSSQVSDAFNTKSRINPDAVWSGSFLPSAKELDILPKK